MITESVNGEQEGVIKFQCVLVPGLPSSSIVAELNRCRRILFELELIGRKGDRYGGLGYGNLSLRTNGNAFVITGSQTGHKKTLERQDYCEVVDANLESFTVRAIGSTSPSSESLSHCAIYSADSSIHSVIHVHWPRLWELRRKLGLRCTEAGITYGTVAMATALIEAVKQGGEPLICMDSHTDGVMTYGRSLDDAVEILLSKGLMLERLGLGAP
jgi:L-ribulose-5-phosphate 4-epimerase